jgi:hypothetical protein
MHPEEVDAFWNFHAVKLSKMQLTGALKKVEPDGKSWTGSRSRRRAGAGDGSSRDRLLRHMDVRGDGLKKL